MLKEIIFGALSVITPSSCLVCDHRNDQGILCRRCLPAEEPTKFGRNLHLWSYSAKAAKIITQAKYKPSAALCVKLGEILGAALTKAENQSQIDLIVPIPPSLIHLRMRGFSHTGLIASGVAKSLRVGISHVALKYSGTSVPQVGLSTQARLENMKGAFRAKIDLVKNRNILLIDDVITTGATIEAAKQALFEAGAKAVSIATLAKVDS